MARPTIYNDDVCNAICEWLASGKSLRSYCKQNGNPAMQTVTRWIVENEAFRVQYAKAREAAGYAHADGVIEIVESVGRGDLDAASARVMMDGRKWGAERMAPKSHMVQSLMHHESPDGSMSPKPTVIEFVSPDFSDESDD